MNDNVNQQLKESKHRSEHNQSKECIIRDVDHNGLSYLFVNTKLSSHCFVLLIFSPYDRNTTFLI